MDIRDKDEIDLKDIIAGFTELKNIAYKNRFKILAFTFLFSGVIIGISFLIPIKYEAKAKLLLKERAGGSPLSGLVGNITGVGSMMGGVGEDAFINIAQTKEVLKNTLINEVDFRGRKDQINNHLLEFLSWREEWSEDKTLQNFRFKHTDPENFTFIEDSIFNCLFELLSENAQVSAEDGGIVNVSIVFQNDTLARWINFNWVNEMIIFFKEKSGASFLSDIEFQTQAIDSLQKIITESEVALTQLKDEHNAIVKAKAFLDEIRLKRKIEINTVLLGEMIKNHEMSKYSYMTQKPIVEIIEMPRLPLKTINMSKLMLGFISVFISGVISIFIYVFIPYL